MDITINSLRDAGATDEAARDCVSLLAQLPESATATDRWVEVARGFLTPGIPFSVHEYLFRTIYSEWDDTKPPPPAWIPTDAEIKSTNISRLRRKTGLADFQSLYEWTIQKRTEFWRAVVETLGVRFRRQPGRLVDLSAGAESPRWLPEAKMNIADSCFAASGDSCAVIYQAEGNGPHEMTYRELDVLTDRFAASLVRSGATAGDAIAIAMPMTVEAVVAYLGIVKAGCVVVSIADSFAPDEIRTRLRIAQAGTVVTQDIMLRAGKTLPMYQKVIEAGARRAIVVTAGSSPAVTLRAEDVAWEDFLVDDASFENAPCAPNNPINILFSSGTTGDPKAIPWDHTTAIKSAMDGHLHHDIKPNEVVAWPTNLGWMMGPWLIFASLLNRATIALFYGSPGTPEFCQFVQDAKVNMLGVVPSLVKSWRMTGAINGRDWTSIKAFSSTGEASNASDMLFLMSRAHYRPIIEYCGGTEIGGGYITGTLVQPASPATFSTSAFGLNFYLLDDSGRPADNGELFLVPPSMGLSNTLLNKDHHEVYYEGTPTGPDGELLRRHGDQMESLPGGFYRAHGRADDTMNLGGIKTSAADIERVVGTIEGISETAAIAVAPDKGGPSRLVIFAVPEPGAHFETKPLAKAMQRAIAEKLNPLFRVYDVVLIDSLPRTASNKVMRRVLRDQFPKNNSRESNNR